MGFKENENGNKNITVGVTGKEGFYHPAHKFNVVGHGCFIVGLGI